MFRAAGCSGVMGQVWAARRVYGGVSCVCVWYVTCLAHSGVIGALVHNKSRYTNLKKSFSPCSKLAVREQSFDAFKSSVHDQVYDTIYCLVFDKNNVGKKYIVNPSNSVHCRAHMLEVQAFLNSCTEFLHMLKTLARARSFYTYLCHQFDAPPTSRHLNNGTRGHGRLMLRVNRRARNMDIWLIVPERGHLARCV